MGMGMLNNEQNFHGWGPYIRCGCCNPAARGRRGATRNWVKKWRQNETQRARTAEKRAWKKEV